MARSRTVVVAAFLLGALLGLSGCGGTNEPGDEPTNGPVEPTETEEPTDGDTGDADDPGDDADPAVSAAVDDLAERLGVDPADVETGELEAVTWRDGAIGCPVPGQAYTQALVDGRRVILTVDGEDYAYHGAGEEPLAFCATPEEPFEVDAATS